MQTCSVTGGVKGRPGTALLLNGGLILSVAEESRRARWRIMELISPPVPEAAQPCPSPAWEPGLLKVQSGKQLGVHVSTLLCESSAPCWGCCYPTGEAVSLASFFFFSHLVIARCLQSAAGQKLRVELGAH